MKEEELAKEIGYTLTFVSEEAEEIYKGCDTCIHVREKPPFVDVGFRVIPRYYCKKLGIIVEQDFYCKYYERK